jgi:hypothetical protein
MTPDEREEIEKEIRAIQEELGIVPDEPPEEPPSSVAASYDRISDLYHRRRHLIAKLETNTDEPCSAGSGSYVGADRRRTERRRCSDRRLRSRNLRSDSQD